MRHAARAHTVTHPAQRDAFETPHPQRQRATRFDLARPAGVSTAVVSYVLNGSPKKISPDTAQRVFDAAQRLDYHPNSVARALKTGTTHTLGVIVPDFSNPYFAEFTDQLVQAYDFLHLYETVGCKLQLGGADQWGNITTGTELIRRKLGNEAEAFAITCPLITKADGTKFGKTESGNVWLDARYTSPYKFYQFWLNVSDEDAKRYIKIFTLLDRETIEALIAEHDAAPHLRVLQRRLAEEVTVMIHSREEYEKAVEASAILFGGATSEALRRLDEQTLLQVFEGVPQFRVARTELETGVPFVELAAEKAQIFPSKGECRKMVQAGGVSLNKEKVADPMRAIAESDLIDGKYLLVQKGKKNYYLVIAE